MAPSRVTAPEVANRPRHPLHHPRKPTMSLITIKNACKAALADAPAPKEQPAMPTAEAQRDDERLDWLEDNWHRAPLGEWEDRYETLRAAIDAAKEQA